MYSSNDFNYDLPSRLIAQEPLKPRDHSRLLSLNRRTGATSHHHFYDIVDFFQAGDVLVLNDSKVFPARLLGHKQKTGGAVEIFLHKKLDSDVWECLVGGRVNEGSVIVFAGSSLQAVIEHNNQDGTWLVRFNLSGHKLMAAVFRIGHVPLPPYIKREAKNAGDKRRYQTVFADKNKAGSAAAPTAGLHFTDRLLKKIKAKGVKIVSVTLHVGLGTFAPVKSENILEHKMHSELAEIGIPAIQAILAAKASGRRVIAVGTTSCRTLESLDWRQMAIDQQQHSLRPQSFWTDIFIYPGFKFQMVDMLITNFHLPKSTLLMLVSAFAGKDKIDEAYRQAIENGYRFFSYGDAMVIF